MADITSRNGLFPDRRTSDPSEWQLKMRCGDDDKKRNHRHSHPNGAVSESEPEVDKIEELYKFIDENLIDNPQYLSIIGCTVSADKIQINIDEDECKDIDATKRSITQTVPEHLKHILAISTKCDSITLCCGVFGSGCHMAVNVQDGAEHARVTLTGQHRTSKDCYTLSIGHFIKKGDYCDINCLCEAEDRKKTAQCVEIHDNTKDVNLNCIKTLIHDMSLLKLDQQLSLENQIKIQEKVFKISLYESRLRPTEDPLIVGSKILIGCGKDNAALRSCILEVSTVKHDVNLVYLTGDGDELEILDGQCGSIVTLSESCSEDTIKAIAYLVGFDTRNGIENRKVAAVLPLHGSFDKSAVGRPVHDPLRLKSHSAWEKFCQEIVNSYNESTGWNVTVHLGLYWRLNIALAQFFLALTVFT